MYQKEIREARVLSDLVINVQLNGVLNAISESSVNLNNVLNRIVDNVPSNLRWTALVIGSLPTQSFEAFDGANLYSLLMWPLEFYCLMAIHPIICLMTLQIMNYMRELSEM